MNLDTTIENRLLQEQNGMQTELVLKIIAKIRKEILHFYIQILLTLQVEHSCNTKQEALRRTYSLMIRSAISECDVLTKIKIKTRLELLYENSNQDGKLTKE
jgi:hypothetical protein